MMGKFTEKTIKLLWGKLASICNFPDCKLNLVENKTLTDDETLIGEMCHIISEKDDGPRGKKYFDRDKINKYDNLILLCNNHHKIIDSQEEHYCVELLHQFKEDHENWVKTKLEIDWGKTNDDLFYAEIMDKWIQKVDLDNWEGWLSFLISPDNKSIAMEKYNNLVELNKWIINRHWPNRYVIIEAFHNFAQILNDLLKVFMSNAKENGRYYYFEKYYKIDE